MKLFENGVGRPSNEIKKKRKIFILAIVLIIVLVAGFIVTNINIESLSGKAYKLNQVDAKIDVYAVSKKNSKFKELIVNFSSVGSKVEYIQVMACPEKEKCNSGEVWDYTRNYKGKYVFSPLERYDKKSTAIHIFKDSASLVMYTGSTNFKTYYMRLETYDKKGNWLYTTVFSVKPINKNRNAYDAGVSLMSYDLVRDYKVEKVYYKSIGQK